MPRSLAMAATATLVAIFVVVACAQGKSGVDLGDEGGAPGEGGAERDVNVIPLLDGAMPVDGSMPGMDGAACTGKVVINELRTDGTTSASDEFVELFNPSPCAVPLGGWTINYEAAGGGTPSVHHTFASGDSIPVNGYLLLASSGFSGKKDGVLTTGFKDTDGQVGLLDDKNKVIDAVAYGTVTAGDYREKAPARSPMSGSSIGRLPNGTDTGSNSADFKALATSSPGVAN